MFDMVTYVYKSPRSGYPRNLSPELPVVREIQGEGKVGILKKKLGKFRKILRKSGKISHMHKVKRSHDATNWKCICIAIQQKLKCNVDLEDPTVIDLSQ